MTMRMRSGRKPTVAAMTPEEFNRLRVQVLGLTQAQLGERIGRTNRTISLYENGSLPIGLDVALKMRELARPRAAAS